MSKRKLDIDATRERMTALGLAYAGEQLEPLLSEAVKQAIAPHAFVDQLLDAEHQGRENRRVRTALRLSSLPTGCKRPVATPCAPIAGRSASRIPGVR